MPKNHALLAASSAERWTTCTPSARLEERSSERKSEYADEGTLAHTLGELIIEQRLELISEEGYAQKFDLLSEHPLFTDSMYEYVEGYALRVLERFSKAKKRSKDAKIFLEKQVDLSEYIPEGFGTIDSIIIADELLDVIDLKFGKGVPVSAIENKQGRVYALGAYLLFGHLFDIRKIRITIDQPRLDSYSSEVISVKDLLVWAEKELRPKAIKAFEGKGELVPGKHCMFCKVKATCKAFAGMNLELEKFAKLKKTSTLTDEQVSEALGKIKMLKEWVSAFEEYVLQEAIKGKKWQGFKLVEGRSQRFYSDEQKVIKKLEKAGFSKELIMSEPELVGITELTKRIKKKNFDSLVLPLLVKPNGKPTLVPEADLRPELNDISAAKEAFKNIKL